LVVYDTNQLTRIVESDLTFYSSDRKYGSNIHALKYSPDGRTLAVGTHGCVIVLCDVINNYQPTGNYSLTITPPPSPHTMQCRDVDAWMDGYCICM
jgi:hypothetical protein